MAPARAAPRFGLPRPLEEIGPVVGTRGHIIGDELGERPDRRYNGAVPGNLMQADPTPEQLGLFLAGDDVDGTPASVEVAVQTALNAARRLATHLGGGTAFPD